MKIHVLLTISLTIVFLFFSGAIANERPTKIYENEVDKLISFYQGRLYLSDSEFTILSEIGNDAKRRIDFLQSKKQFLISEMQVKNIKLAPAKIKAFVCKKMMVQNVGFAYTAP